MAPLTSHHQLPPFPEGVKTAPLVSVSYVRLQSGDREASDAFFRACKELGFFYLDMLGSDLGEMIVAEAERLNLLQKEFFKLPNEVKETYGQKVLDPFYAYRYSEFDVSDAAGVPLRREDYNLRKDDILGNCERLDCHQLILDHQELFRSYVLHCRQVIDCMLEHLNTYLELPAGTLASIHRLRERSGDHVRFAQAPVTQFDAVRAKKGEHTDFGSITILFNWLGGLQIRTPDTEEWVYVKPIPGSCVVNLGDALVKFTAGLLRSNIHRVVPPLGEQASLPRNSLVYFSRPEDKVVLKRMRSPVIDMQPASELEEPELTAHEWIMAKGSGKFPGVYTIKGFEYHDKDAAVVAAPREVSGTA